MQMVRAGRIYTRIYNIFAQFLPCFVGVHCWTWTGLTFGLSWYSLCYVLTVMDSGSTEDFRVYLSAFR